MKRLSQKMVLVAAGMLAGALAAAPVDEAIAKGARFLLSKQAEDGHFSDAQMPALTALPLWALSLSQSSLPPTLPSSHSSTLPSSHSSTLPSSLSSALPSSLSRAAAFVLSTQRPDGGFYVPKPGRGGSGLGNYNTSVCLTALFESKLAPTAPLLKARAYIASSQLVGDDTMAGGFGYDKVSRRRYADLSNTSYALDAMARTSSLEELRTGGKRVDLDWAKAIAFVERLQKKQGEDKGGAAYNARTPQAGTATNQAGRVHLRAYGSMSYAAVLSMCSASLTKADPRVREALDYCSRYWSLEENPGMGSQGLYYYYDILARALGAAGVEELRTPDGRTVRWKDELVAKLLALQKPDGSWFNDNNRFWEGDPVLCTSFALICLNLGSSKAK